MITALLSCSPSSPLLGLPIACEVGEDCWISNRPDIDPGPAFRTHDGSDSTYDSHDGTDVSVRDVGQAVSTWVIAPSGGTVLRVRDGMVDGELLASGRRAVDGSECGNAVVLGLGNDWEIQLCHLLRGSVAVEVGQHIERGAPLGRVGWSGLADNPHVHLLVRRAGRAVDPFSGLYLDDGTVAARGALWADPIPAPTEMDALAWAGFDAGPPRRDEPWPIDAGRGLVRASAPSLLFHVFLWRPERDDIVRIDTRSPDGVVKHTETTQTRDRPRQVFSFERTWPPDERPVGLWTAHVQWERDGRTRELWASTILQ